MNLSWLELFIFALASFRITRLIVEDTIMEWLRKPFMVTTVHINDQGEEEQWIEPNGWIGEGLSCFWCVGVWASAFVIIMYIFVPYGWLLVLLFAIAGMQALIYGWSQRYL
ncbi:DUF1360 domain-containing protein [Halobacillus salinarum]|uniref:DUF1360 domain-containing protein n=1 Tax=Halobacillus salinarum TaxID=2932257 RepID=A0ABY4EH02_9BACI|nr:DUF1360 domain-containing protein [Halobacillus salinarum]UOQ43411.1 DUF1360 domain-containing protein [Halobacillus salinarum]